jgi:SNF family Na+-dependent transporter
MSKKSTIEVKTVDSWGSRIGLVLAMAGNAVGFGNFLRFPVQAMQNGGGAFIIPYLVSLVILGVPLLLIEWSSGRYGGLRGHHSTPFIMQSLHKSVLWRYVGVFGIFCNIAIASYYCYMESWTFSYIYYSISGEFNGMDQHQVANVFSNYLDIRTTTTGIPYEAMVFFVLVLALNVWILSKGLSGGIEKAAKIGVPLLIVFGIFLAYKGITLKAGQDGAVFNGTMGLNFIWQPKFDSLTNPKVWLAAAGQIFFTLSVGMGSIQCYASYLKKRSDVAANSMSAGMTNEFVEIVLGSSILIPIAVGYLGIDRVVELTGMGGLGLSFRTMPYLFQQWGPILSALAGVAFFGLLFFAGITSSLAMGTPVIAFLKDEFGWGQKSAAYLVGVIIFVLGMPTVIFFNYGVFDEYDYWAGTISLVVFAMLESILFAWFFGIDKGWAEINKGADIKLPIVFKYLIGYITPIILIVIFIASLIQPVNDDWSKLSWKGWELSNGSIIGQINHKGIGPNNRWFSDTYYSDVNGVYDTLVVDELGRKKMYINSQDGGVSVIDLTNSGKVAVSEGSVVKVGDPLWHGDVINKVFYIDLSRILLLSVFVGISLMVWKAGRNYKKKGLEI